MQSKDQAELIGVKALVWLIGQEDLIGVFMGATGASVDDLKAGAGDPVFLGAVLDFMLMDDQHIIDFSTDAAIPPNAPYEARQMLPGGDLPNWT
jgi:hypothetical protein